MPAAVAPQRAAEVLGRGREPWAGERVATDGLGRERRLATLELRVGDASPRVAFHKAAHLELGPLVSGPEGSRLEISWRAAGLAPLFPVFAGQLSWRDGSLSLDGYYAPPGGSVGLVVDRLILHVAARATARRLLERIAAVMREGGRPAEG